MTQHEPTDAGKRLECSGCGYWLNKDGQEPPGGWENWFHLRHAQPINHERTS